MPAKKMLRILPIVFLCLASCGLDRGRGEPVPQGVNRCGNGICEGPENASNCAADCAKSDPVPTKQAEGGGESDTVSLSSRPLLYLGIMVHLEGWQDDRDEARFERHAGLVREYADLFEAYDAILTLESKELTDGSIRWGDNVLLEMEQRGHGVGVHADIGGSADYDCDQFAHDLQKERIQLESVGVEVRHVSGNTSHCDWVTATVDAGYEFTSGTVAYNVMSLREEDRPPEYRNCPTPSKCHQVFPPTLEQRLHPWRAVDGLSWLTHDPEGGLVILASDGGLDCIQEETEGGVMSDCVFDVRDIDYAVGQIENALALADPEQVNLIYFSWSLGKVLDMDVMEAWLQAMKLLIDQGDVAWASLPEIYDAYLVWERSN